MYFKINFSSTVCLVGDVIFWHLQSSVSGDKTKDSLMCCPLTASARVDSQQALITLMNAASSSPCSEWDSPVFMPWLLWMHVKQPAHASVSMATSSKPALFQVQRTESEGWVGGVGGRNICGCRVWRRGGQRGGGWGERGGVRGGGCKGKLLLYFFLLTSCFLFPPLLM